MEKQECPKCGKSYSAKGIITHIKFCKPTLSETSDPKVNLDSMGVSHCTDAKDASGHASKDVSTEETEKSKESDNTSYYLIIIILAIFAIIFFIKTGSLKMENQK